jgi:hypothetical protein
MIRLHTVRDVLPAGMGDALAAFEGQFDYPLGTHCRFRISHGRDYLPFFKAMGAATLLVAENNGAVVGTIARVERSIHLSSDPAAPRLAHYLCDLKVSPNARRGRVLASLMLETRRQIEASTFHACYAIVMEGTRRSPTDYTGRLGIPGFDRLADLSILRLSTGQSTGHQPPPPATAPPIRPICRVTGGNIALRSLLQPIRIGDENGRAGGILGDTRRGKRLLLESGTELLSAHLSGFHFDTPSSGAAVLLKAMDQARLAGLPALFVAVPTHTVLSLKEHLEHLGKAEIGISPARIHGYGLPTDHDWWVDTAEI